MCGRFADYFETEELVDVFGAERVVDPPAPSWNVAPTSKIAVVRAAQGNAPSDGDGPGGDAGGMIRELRGGRWGLVPSWAKDPLGGARLINARSETVTVKPSFRSAARSRRALIPAAGYYEWESAASGPKTPYYLHPPDGGPIAMAGLYEWWWPPGPVRAQGPGTVPDPLFSATVITRAATDSTGQIHDRMPLIVPAEAWADWLDPALREPAQVQELIASLPDPELIPRRVGRAVGSVRNNGPHLIEPA
ncbi:MAG: SOS response-associated peptidase [Bifidobacteriaceae bacterium]|jgi:putative SOS response-associated peptidase YedK|nr:SOS response-associated peptidase [Bifidobacteriaceae bacterium]